VTRVKTDMMPSGRRRPRQHQNRRITPERHPHAAIEALVSQARAVAEVLDQVILLTCRRGDARDAPAVDELLLDLVAPPGWMRTGGSPGCSEETPGGGGGISGSGSSLGGCCAARGSETAKSARARIRRDIGRNSISRRVYQNRCAFVVRRMAARCSDIMQNKRQASPAAESCRP